MRLLSSHHFLSVDDHHTLIVLADTLSGEVVDGIVMLVVGLDSGNGSALGNRYIQARRHDNAV